MGEILAEKLKWYGCEVFEPGDDHGGDIDLSNEITSGIANNVFPNVTDAERIAGAEHYAKIFFRNENEADYTNALAWIQANTPAVNDEIQILRAGTKSLAGEPVKLTQTNMQFTAGATDVTGVGTAFLSELAVGEKIYNGTDDSEPLAVAIASIESDTSLTLEEEYAGTGSGGCQGYVAGADQCAFVKPDTKDDADVLALGTLGEDEYAGIWIKRVVQSGGVAGYTNNSATIRVEDS